MKAVVGFVGIPEHAEQSVEHAVLAGIPTPLQTIAALGTYFMTFGGDSERAIEQTQLAVAAARAIGDEYEAVHYRSNCLTYTALLAPGTDETLRLADEVRSDVERSGASRFGRGGSRPWRPRCSRSIGSAPLALLDEAVDLATREKLRDAIGTCEFWRGIVLFTAPALCRRRDRLAAIPRRLPRLGQPSGHDQRAVLCVRPG